MLGCLVVILSVFARKLTPLTIMAKERTFIAVKPDGVQRGIVGEIIKRFEAKGFKLAGMKFMQASEDHLQKHYADLSDKPFFAGLVKYMASGPLVAMCWEGTGVVKTARQMMGETKPADSKPGTIRGDFCIEVGRNIIHGSDSVESAEKEISLWFKPEELVSWTQAAHDWIYEFLNKLGDRRTESWMASLNSYLQDRSYIQCYVPSRSDLVVFFNIDKVIEVSSYPHLYRWSKNIKYICQELKLNARNYEFSNIDRNQNSKKSQNLVEVEKEIIGMNAKNEKNHFKVQEEDQESNKLSPNVYAVLLEVRPKDEETDMKELESIVKQVAIDGLEWGASQFSHSGAYGLQKLSIICTVEDDKVSIQDVLEKLIKFEDYVLQVDIAGFNKL